MKKDLADKKAAAWVMLVTLLVFTVASIVATIYQLARGKTFFGARGAFLPLLIALPWLLAKMGFKPGYYLYTLAYAFMIFAFTYGNLLGGFKGSDVTDKVSHFLSGFLFAILGYCLYYKMAARRLNGQKSDLFAEWKPSSFFALGFSTLVAIIWEVFEFFDFLLTRNDSQNHLTAGVFDTMLDVISALFASLISVAAFILYRFAKVKLLTALVVDEFYEANCMPPGAGEE